MCMCVCACVSLYDQEPMEAKRAVDPLKLEVQVIMSH